MSKQKKNNKKNKNKISLSWIYLGVVFSAYLILSFIYPEQTTEAYIYSFDLIKTIIPILILVVIFMFLTHLINEKKFEKLMNNSPKPLKYLAMVGFGTFSHGPIYAWYPLMRTFHEKGLSYGPIASFLYSRGIKLPLIPALVGFFGIEYAIILTVYLLLFAYIQGVMVDLFFEI